MRRTILLTTITSLALLPALAAWQSTAPPPTQGQRPGLTFRAVANYVELDAIVTDERGEAVRDLTCADFDVQVDGKGQRLDVCGFVDIPIIRPDPLLFADKVIEPDVATNEKTFDGRVFMIVLDGYHVSTTRSNEVRKQAERFIRRYMGENDLAAVVHVGNPAAGQEFTGNKRLLVAAVQKFTAQGLPSITESINRDALQKNDMQAAGFDPGPPTDQEALVREYMARESIESIRRLSEYLATLGGRRKAVLLFSEGIGIDFLSPQGVVGQAGAFQPARRDPQAVRLSQQNMFSAAAKSNVSIYSIDPRGLTPGTDTLPGLGVTPAAPEEGATIRDYSNGTVMVDAMDEVRRAQDMLREFAEQTGGLAMVNKNDMDEAFSRVVIDNSSYYVLGYQSADPRHDGRYHRVSIKVKRPGLTVRTRRGYFAPDDAAAARKKPRDPVVQMLSSPVLLGGLGMRASASVIKGLLDKSTVHLTVEFSGRDVPLKASGGLYTNQIDIEYLALDMKGQSQANVREIAHLQLKPATQATFLQDGVRYVTEFELAAGRYQLRVAARERLGGRAGSVFHDLEVPDLAKLPLAMSHLLITTSSAAKTSTPNNTSTIGQLLPTPTTTTREFNAADTLTVAASIYDNDPRAPHRVDIKATITSDAGAELFMREEVRESREMTAAKGGYAWVVAMPLKALAPGRYVVAIDARSRLSGVDPIRREVEFRIK